MSCSSSLQNSFRSTFDSHYKVIDQGGLETVVATTVCAMKPREAEYESRKNAEFKLRSILGDKRYMPQFEELNRYRQGDRICVEMQARPK